MDLNDQLLSMRTWLWSSYLVPVTTVVPPYVNQMRLESEGRVRNFTRPMWEVQRLNHRTVDYGAVGYRDDCLWLLTYYGISRGDADSVLSTLNYLLQNDNVRRNRFNRIPGYRFNWQYPTPALQSNVVTPGPGLPAGPYSVRVSGLDMCGNESAASVPVLVNLVSPNNAIRVRILRAPSIVPVFYAYNIYVNNRLEVAGLLQPGMRPVAGGPPVIVGGSNTVYAIANLSNLLGTGVPPKEPSNSVPVRWKWIRVNSYADATKEDDEQDGLFNGMVTMETSVFQERDQPQPDVVRNVGISMKVYSPVISPPVPNYAITSTNQVIVNVSAG